MRIVYIILAHMFPELLIRLVNRLNEGCVSFLIHVDRKTDDVTYQAMTDGLARYPNVRFLQERVDCHWADFDIVAATLLALRQFVAKGEPGDRVVLLSGQTYPIKSSKHIREFFETHPEITFLENFPMPRSGWQVDGGMYLLERGKAVRGISAMEVMRNLLSLVEADKDDPTPRRHLPLGLKPFSGSQWWALTYESAKYVVRFADEHPEVVDFFENVVVADEMFFQTVLLNSPLRNVIRSNNLHYLEWHGGVKCLDFGDFDRLVASDMLFARKFDPHHDVMILDHLDDHLNNLRSSPEMAQSNDGPLVEALPAEIELLLQEFTRHAMARIEAQAERIGRLRAERDRLRADNKRLRAAFDRCASDQNGHESSPSPHRRRGKSKKSS